MPKLVCFGDSITAGKEGWDQPMLTAKLSAELPGYEIINAGVSGNNTVEALERIEEDVLRHKPDLMTVLFGANDAALKKKVELEEFRKNLQKIVEQIGPHKTILISPSPVDEDKQDKRTNGVLSQYALAVKETAEATDSMFIDFYKEFLSHEDYKEKLIGVKDDGLHFGEAGYNILVDLIAKRLNEL